MYKLKPILPKFIRMYCVIYLELGIQASGDLIKIFGDQDLVKSFILIRHFHFIILKCTFSGCILQSRTQYMRDVFIDPRSYPSSKMQSVFERPLFKIIGRQM